MGFFAEFVGGFLFVFRSALWFGKREREREGVEREEERIAKAFGVGFF
jgi:hypothetical protein